VVKFMLSRDRYKLLKSLSETDTSLATCKTYYKVTINRNIQIEISSKIISIVLDSYVNQFFHLQT